VSSRAILNNPAVFYSAFVGELRRHKWPAYPTVSWHLCLRIAVEADAAVLRAEQMHVADARYYRQIGYCQQYRIPEHRESLPIAGRSAAARSVDAACDRFLQARGIPSGDFHAY
jgi:hypothetical protein